MVTAHSVNSKTSQPTNEAQLNFVSLRSELDDEVTWELSRVEMNVPIQDALDSSQVTGGGCAPRKEIIKDGPPRRP
jgi:hypothetical protein